MGTQGGSPPSTVSAGPRLCQRGAGVEHLQCEAGEKGSWRQAQGEVVSLNCRIHLVKEELDSSGSPCPVRESWKKREKLPPPVRELRRSLKTWL